MRRRLARVPQLAVPVGAAVLLALVAGLAGFGTLGLTVREEDPLFGTLEISPRGPELRPDPPELAGVEPEPETGAGLAWGGDVLLVVAGAVALLCLVLAVRAVRRALLRRPGRRRGGRLRLRPLPVPGDPATPEQPDQQLLAAVDAGLVELSDDDHDPRRAVIACWLRLEEVAAAAGVARQPHDTAGELVVRLLRTRRVSEPVLAGLADVFRLARFGNRAVDEEMRAAAQTALRRLREELPAPVTGGGQ